MRDHRRRLLGLSMVMSATSGGQLDVSLVTHADTDMSKNIKVLTRNPGKLSDKLFLSRSIKL